MEKKANFFIKNVNYPLKGKSKIFLSDIKQLDFCGKNFGFEANASVFELPYPIQLTEGEHDFESCESCQINHAFLLKQFSDKYKGLFGTKMPFPYCCPTHTYLSKQEWFNKNEFDLLNIPKLVADKIIFTKQHILNKYNEPDWFDDITDYINYVVSSFGQMPNDCGEPLYLSNYLSNVVELLKQLSDFPEHKKNRILEFLISATTPKEKQQTDLNILLKTYQDWYKIFPFELSCFAELKEKFYPTIPKISFAGQPIVNRYSGVAVVKMHSKSTLFDALIELTNTLLTQINGVILYEQGLLTDGDKYRLELSINKRKLKLKQGYINNSTDEDTRFRKILKEWFKDECKFIDEITPLLKSNHQLPPARISSHPEPFETPEAKPVFNSEIIEQLYSILKKYFSEEQQPQLDHLLKTGNNITSKLIFKDNGNRLTDTFRKLYEHDLITGCKKETLQKWIVDKFGYLNSKSVPVDYNYDTVHKYISKNDFPCRNPIILIENSKIVKVNTPRKKKGIKNHKKLVPLQVPKL